MQEARELANDPSTDYTAAPLEVCRRLYCLFPALKRDIQDDIFVSGSRRHPAEQNQRFPCS